MSIGKEALLLKAHISNKKEDLKKIDRRADNLIISVREILSSTTEDFTEMDLDRAVVAIEDLVNLKNEATAIRDSIKKLERELNG